ncbi:response regulator [Clostridium cibarium]|uniref:Stage 0 sporulation protein A homolog n=1 Tax=Clostridium cibarium TaxID=2762247 RepID=A0ABR8PS58_9CLOT|nr:response regulator [Clostridium cibarium]MBD7911011.1 response regulator [Clostridium cibarium]
MKKVLIVDDASFMRINLRKILEKNGFEVVGEAADGLEAIRKYFTLKPDIVTMDITMPKMDGIEALREIKNKDSSAKIIMISALGQEKWVRKAVIQGAIGFIVKPYKDDYVVQALNKL